MADLEWSLQDFHANPDFQGMEEKHRVKLEECFMLILVQQTSSLMGQVPVLMTHNFATDKKSAKYLDYIQEFTIFAHEFKL